MAIVYNFRKTVRERIKSLLEGKISHVEIDNTTKILEIYQNRNLPYWEMELPLVSLYSLKDPVDNKKTKPRRYYHEYDIQLELILMEEKMTPDGPGMIADDLIDEITEQIEHIFDKDPTLGDLIDDSYLKETRIVMTEKGEKFFVAALMTYTIEYQTAAPRNVDEGLVVDLETANTGVSVDGGDDPDEPDLEAKTELQEEN